MHVKTKHQWEVAMNTKNDKSKWIAKKKKEKFLIKYHEDDQLKKAD
jgi:hypothetical protein